MTRRAKRERDQERRRRAAETLLGVRPEPLLSSGDPELFLRVAERPEIKAELEKFGAAVSLGAVYPPTPFRYGSVEVILSQGKLLKRRRVFELRTDLTEAAAVEFFNLAFKKYRREEEQRGRTTPSVQP